MFDFFCVFTTGGVVLWAKVMADAVARYEVLNALVKNILLEEKSTKSSHIHNSYTIKWKFANDLGLVFAVVYRDILQIARVEDLLSLMFKEFVKVMPECDDGIYRGLPVDFNKQF